jgi:REP element-mobilizing transposase RayT
MARPLRIIYEGAFYHVTARGNERRRIFLSHRDYEKFLSYLAEAVHKYSAILHAFVLMANHYHLIVETPKGNLSAFMHNLNSAYTTYFNIKRRRAGHLFQGRYKALLIDVDNYLLELSRYIHLNPVRAGITERPEAYRYSSYRAYIFPKEEALIFRDLLWSMVTKKRKDGPRYYREFVEGGLTEKPRNPFQKVYGGVILGGKKFIEEVLDRLNDQDVQKKETSHRRFLRAIGSDMGEIVDLVCNQFKVSREQVLSTSPYKGYAVYLARKHTPFSNPEIGRYFGGISYSAVTKIGTRIKDRMRKDGKLREEMAELQKGLSRVKG